MFLLEPMGLSREEYVRGVLLSGVLLLPLRRRLTDTGLVGAVAELEAPARERGVIGDSEDRVRGSTSCSYASCSRWRAARGVASFLSDTMAYVTNS